MNLQIRRAEISDAEAIAQLLDQLGYPNSTLEKIKRIITLENDYILVHEDASAINAVIALHIVPELALQGDTATIKYLVVDENMRGKNIGEQLEKACCEIAQSRGCTRIQLHCGEQRTRTHEFYYRLGYTESPKFLEKTF